MYSPHWLSGAVELPRQFTAFVAYRTDDLALLNEQERSIGWHVPAGLTARITEAGTRWGRFNGADVYLNRSIHTIRTKNPDVGQALADAAVKFGQAGVNYLQNQPRRKVSMELSNQGRVCYSVMDDTVSWQDRLAQVTQAMAAFPTDTDLAFVQYSNIFTTTCSDLATVRPPLPHVRESHVRYNRHLYTRYVPDAHGVQLLTHAHLANANNLSDWNTEPLLLASDWVVHRPDCFGFPMFPRVPFVCKAWNAVPHSLTRPTIPSVRPVLRRHPP